ncbi:hypothetical protein GGR51DRAFT_541419 [Nemania sp. FL0031]|nr:hypothetical protein GGR51DRAFT_541419 [Nemania sp. FL0031]
MNASLYHPRPQRPCKRAFSDIDADHDLETYLSPIKHPRCLSPLPSPGCPLLERLGDKFGSLPPLTSYQATRSVSAPPQPTQLRRQRGRPQKSPNESLVSAWLDTILSLYPRPATPSLSRPSSCPPTLDLARGKHAPPSLAKIKHMLQNGEDAGSNAGTSHSGRHSTSHPLYRGTLYNNNIQIDYAGRRIPAELRKFVEANILKRRESPQLGDEAVTIVMDLAEELADSTEGPITKLMRTEMFPFDRPGIAEAGNSPWSTVALPNNPEYQYAVMRPKPDAYFGYPINQRSRWPTSQYNVITHPVARPYAQPAKGNTFPFVSIQMKSEAAGGTLYVAENQAAGSGSHCVSSLIWLLREAGTYNDSTWMDTIAFTISMSQRQAVFYIHWYSEDDHRYYMSLLNTYSTLIPSDIRACNSTVRNIMDYGLGRRKSTISAALEALFPYPTKWKQGRSAATASSSSLIQDTGPL